MSSWLAITVVPKENKKEEVRQFLEDFYGVYRGVGQENNHVIPSARGHHQSANEYQPVISTNIAKLVVGISVSDTSSCGDAIVYDNVGNEWVRSNYFEGYEGLKGMDVARLVIDQYDVRPDIGYY